MKLSINDPRLTAYALGEIEDPNEHAEISRIIAFSPELQAAVAEIRKTGDILGDALMSEIEPALSEFEKARISQCAQPKLVKRMAINLRQHWHLVAGLAAACLAAAVVWLPKLQDSPTEYAYHQAEKNGYVGDRIIDNDSMETHESLGTPALDMLPAIESIELPVSDYALAPEESFEEEVPQVMAYKNIDNDSMETHESLGIPALDMLPAIESIELPVSDYALAPEESFEEEVPQVMAYKNIDNDSMETHESLAIPALDMLPAIESIELPVSDYALAPEESFEEEVPQVMAYKNIDNDSMETHESLGIPALDMLPAIESIELPVSDYALAPEESFEEEVPQVMVYKNPHNALALQEPPQWEVPLMMAYNNPDNALALQEPSRRVVEPNRQVVVPNRRVVEPSRVEPSRRVVPQKMSSIVASREFDNTNARNPRDAFGTNSSTAFMLNTIDTIDSPQITLREGFNTQMQSSAAFNTESYDPIEETDFRSPLVAPLSTFSIDVDTASYANVRRFIQQGQLPPTDTVRIEELINYFSYADSPPTKSLEGGGDPFAVHMTQATAPWNAEHQLLRIALKGYEMPWEERPASNLVFLLDVSGSMSAANKLPLVKTAMDMLIRRLGERDKVAIVVYAGASGLVLPSTTANNYETIAHALKNLHASGSTNGGAGIELAYKTAREHFIEGGNNRVILCTDGDFNIGQTSRSSLAKKAEAAADEGISLSVLGFGMHNYKDDMLETLSNKGKGSYAYIDSSAEARKVFLKDLTGNLFKIAKDVKIQVEFNPAQVKAYRLIGYENRRLKAEDFNNDAKKAGDIGPGHSIVALYEIVPIGGTLMTGSVDPLRYQAQPLIDSKKPNAEVATVKLRYKKPEGDQSQLITSRVQSDDLVSFESTSDDFRFTAAVAAFGLRLTKSEHLRNYSYKQIESLAIGAIGEDSGGHRSEFIDLVLMADSIQEKIRDILLR